MTTLLIVTHVDFWRKGAGHRARIASLVTYLKDKACITVVFAGQAGDSDVLLVMDQFPGIEFHILHKSASLTYGQYATLFEHYIQNKYYQVVLVEYIEMSFVLPYLSSDSITLLDTHDIVSERIKSFDSFKLPYDGIALTRDEELSIFECFDKVLLIQKSDYKTIASQLNADQVLLVPHAVSFSKQEVRKPLKHIGFVASAYTPNYDALHWFLKEVWPAVYSGGGLHFNIFGPIAESFSSDYRSGLAGVTFHGFTDDLDQIYQTCDVMVNPVRCGAGLKVKNIEALGNGLPLITSLHGAAGIEDGAGNAFLIANTAIDYQYWINVLSQDYEFRSQISGEAYRYAWLHFSPVGCYRSLLEVIHSASNTIYAGGHQHEI